MKRKALKITRYIIAGLLAVIVGVTIYKGVAASEETDRTLEHIDRKIAKYDAKYEADPATYRQVKAEIKKLKSDAETEKIVEKTDFATFSAQKRTVEAEELQAKEKLEQEVNEDENTAAAEPSGGNGDSNPDSADSYPDPDHSYSVDSIEAGTVTEVVNDSQEIVNDLVEGTTISPEEFMQLGVIDWRGWRYTWYSENVLPGEGLQIPGRWSDGYFVRDQWGYLCVACNEIPQGATVSTPFGSAVVYDTIGDGVTGVIDIYVSF